MSDINIKTHMYEYEIKEILIFKSWIDKHINDETLINYYGKNCDFLEEDIYDRVDESLASVLNCITYGKISNDTREELSNTKIYGKVYYLMDENGTEAYLTQNDLSSTLVSYLDKDKTLRQLYDKLYIEYDYLAEDLRIDKSVRDALTSYLSYYQTPFKERYKLAVKDLKNKLHDLTKDDKEIDPSTLSDEQLKDSL